MLLLTGSEFENELCDVESSTVKRTRTCFCLSSSLGTTELDCVPSRVHRSPWGFVWETLGGSRIQAVTKEKRLKGRSACCLHLLDEPKGCANEAWLWEQLLTNYGKERMRRRLKPVLARPWVGEKWVQKAKAVSHWKGPEIFSKPGRRSPPCSVH